MVVDMKRLGLQNRPSTSAITYLSLHCDFPQNNIVGCFDYHTFVCSFMMPLCLTTSPSLKGKSNKSQRVMAVYEPLIPRGEGKTHFVAATIAQLHDKAFEFYRQRLFSQAAEKFAQAKRLCRRNPDLFISAKPSVILHSRCIKFISQPPPRDWQLLPQGTN